QCKGGGKPGNGQCAGKAGGGEQPGRNGEGKAGDGGGPARGGEAKGGAAGGGVQPGESEGGPEGVLLVGAAARQGRGNDQQAPLPPQAGRSWRPSVTQLEDFQHRVDANILKDARLDPKAFRDLLANYKTALERQQFRDARENL